MNNSVLQFLQASRIEVRQNNIFIHSDKIFDVNNMQGGLSINQGPVWEYSFLFPESH